MNTSILEPTVKRGIAVLSVILIIAGCAATPTERPRAELIWASSGSSPVVMDDVRFGPAGNLVKSEVRIRNKSGQALNLQYKFEWRDMNGFTQSDVLSWQQLNMSPKEVKNINSVGKTPDSYGIQLTVRRVTSAFDD